ncbi:MAG: ATP-binding domain-containing protein, partial [Pseudobutyrivibrio sp.]|nr:ATP-binding domain-containing protein [Pseudobutyrivibrio sp.]
INENIDKQIKANPEAELNINAEETVKEAGSLTASAPEDNSRKAVHKAPAVKTPWEGHTEGIPMPLHYFQGSMFEAVEKTAEKYPNSIAFDFMGRKTSYRRLVEETVKCAKALRTIGVREGDKVMQVKNNYQLEWIVEGKYGIKIDSGLGIFNGDVGVITDINDFSKSLWVEFDEGRKVEYMFKDLDELELAYAITIHKSQGSEYPAVVMPVMAGPRMLMNRNILYTAITRAKKCVTLVGDDSVFYDMIDNTSQAKRYSGLESRIKEQENI